MGLTVTTGVIGGLNRTLRAPPPRARPMPARSAALGPGRGRHSESRVFDDFIQIDAAINPGNSGGPLLDVTGRWIGVNTAIWNRRRTVAEGVGFAIPVDRVRSLVGRAFKRRLIRGDWLGVEFEEGPGGDRARPPRLPQGARAAGAACGEGDEVVSLDGDADAHAVRPPESARLPPEGRDGPPGRPSRGAGAGRAARDPRSSPCRPTG